MSSESFRAAMRTAGLEYSGPVIADGRLHRFKTEGDRERNSWYVLRPAPPAVPAAVRRLLPVAHLLIESDPALRLYDEIRLANRLRVLVKRLSIVSRIR